MELTTAQKIVLSGEDLPKKDGVTTVHYLGHNYEFLVKDIIKMMWVNQDGTEGILIDFQGVMGKQLES